MNAFIGDGTISVREASKAEAVMTGTVTEYRREAYTYDKTDNVSQYAANVKIHVKVVKANTDEVIWEEDFFAQGVYDPSTETEEDGQNKAIAILKSNILDRTTKSW